MKSPNYATTETYTQFNDLLNTALLPTEQIYFNVRIH